MNMTPEQTVRQFIDAFRVTWPSDFDVALAPLAEDASTRSSCRRSHRSAAAP